MIALACIRQLTLPHRNPKSVSPSLASIDPDLTRAQPREVDEGDVDYAASSTVHSGRFIALASWHRIRSVALHDAILLMLRLLSVEDERHAAGLHHDETYPAADDAATDHGLFVRRPSVLDR